MSKSKLDMMHAKDKKIKDEEPFEGELLHCYMRTSSVQTAHPSASPDHHYSIAAPNKPTSARVFIAPIKHRLKAAAWLQPTAGHGN
jgi:hypothetical protein